MRATVLGGTGVIGIAATRALMARGVDVTVVSRHDAPKGAAGVAWRAGDIADAAGLRAVLASLRPDVVVHLAAYLQHACELDPAEAVRINVDGTVNVLECCRALGVPRIVFGSSIAAYGERRELMHEEDASTANISLYGMTKRLGEMLGQTYARIHGIGFVALRYSGVFGPGKVSSPGMALVREQIKSTADGSNVTIEGASGNERVHLTHVTDAAEATCLAALHPGPAHQLYNVAGPPGNYMSLRDFHAAVRALVPAAGEVVWGRPSRSAGPVDMTRIRDGMGFAPSVSVLQGLAADLGVAIDRGHAEAHN